jgi:hypothetical protein
MAGTQKPRYNRCEQTVAPETDLLREGELHMNNDKAGYLAKLIIWMVSHGKVL